MKHSLILLALLALSSCSDAEAISYDDYPDGKPRNSYERQREEYRQHGYDSYRNGPVQETLEQQRREQRRQEEYRRDNAEQNRRESERNYHGGERCRGLYGC